MSFGSVTNTTLTLILWNIIGSAISPLKCPYWYCGKMFSTHSELMSHKINDHASDRYCYYQLLKCWYLWFTSQRCYKLDYLDSIILKSIKREVADIYGRNENLIMGREKMKKMSYYGKNKNERNFVFLDRHSRCR